MSTLPTLLSRAQVDRDVMKSYGAYQISSATFETSYHKKISQGFPTGSDRKESTCNPGDPGSIPGSGRSPGEANGNPLQYYCLENPMDGGEIGRAHV